MKIQEVRKTTAIVEMTHKELSGLIRSKNKTYYLDDIKKACFNEIDMPLGFLAENFIHTDRAKLSILIGDIKSVETFLSSKLSRLEEEDK